MSLCPRSRSISWPLESSITISLYPVPRMDLDLKPMFDAPASGGVGWQSRSAVVNPARDYRSVRVPFQKIDGDNFLPDSRYGYRAPENPFPAQGCADPDPARTLLVAFFPGGPNGIVRSSAAKFVGVDFLRRPDPQLSQSGSLPQSDERFAGWGQKTTERGMQEKSFRYREPSPVPDEDPARSNLPVLHELSYVDKDVFLIPIPPVVIAEPEPAAACNEAAANFSSRRWPEPPAVRVPPCECERGTRLGFGRDRNPETRRSGVNCRPRGDAARSVERRLEVIVFGSITGTDELLLAPPI